MNDITVEKRSLVTKFAEKYSIEANKLLETLKRTAFKGSVEISNEQMAALLVVADQYGLNPFVKEIYAFPDKGAIVPVVGVDGWNRIANEHPMFDGVDFIYSPDMAQPEGSNSKCHEYVEVRLFRKDRAHPIVVREYLDECYRPTGPWKSHPKRMLRHKALVQCFRVGFGFAGIYDQDEAERIIEAEVINRRVEKPINASISTPAPALDFDKGAVDTYLQKLRARCLETGQWSEAIEVAKSRLGVDSMASMYAENWLQKAKAHADAIVVSVPVESDQPTI